MQKLEIIHERVVLAVAGDMGVAQQFRFAIKCLMQEHNVDEMDPDGLMQKLAEYKAEAIIPQLRVEKERSEASKTPFDGRSVMTESIVALRVNGIPRLYRFDGAKPEQVVGQSPFVIIGTGKKTTHPFLEYIRQKYLHGLEPDLADGILMAMWGVNFAMATGARDVGGNIQVAIVPSDPSRDVRLIAEADMAEHYETLGRAELSLKELRLAIRGQLYSLSENQPSEMPE